LIWFDFIFLLLFWVRWFSFLHPRPWSEWKRKLLKLLPLVDFSCGDFFYHFLLFRFGFFSTSFLSEMVFLSHPTSLELMKEKVVKTFPPCWSAMGISFYPFFFFNLVFLLLLFWVRWFSFLNLWP
jgi:hypothetical protein